MLGFLVFPKVSAALPFDQVRTLADTTKETLDAFDGTDFVQVKAVSCDHRDGLAAGDIIVEKDQKQVTKMSDLRDMFSRKSLELTIVRHHVELHLKVPTIPISRWQGNRVVWFAGGQFELPFYPVPLITRELYSEVFLSRICEGSPAEMCKLQPRSFVIQVNGMTTLSFNDFVRELQKLQDNQVCQITWVNREGLRSTTVLMPNLRDFSTTEAHQMKSEPYKWEFKDFSRK